MKKILVVSILMVFVLSLPASAGVVNYWSLDTDASDSVGGQNGVISGATAVAGVVGGALHFDGDDEVLISSFAPDAGFQSGMTFAAWVKPDVGNTNGSIARVFSAHDGWEFVIQGGTGQAANNFYRTGGTYPKSTEMLPEGQWTHVAMTSVLGDSTTPGRMEIYINGVFDVALDLAVNDWTGGDLKMGARPGRPLSENYMGALDEVMLFNTVLDADEIAALVPEPATMLLLGLGGLLIRKRK